MIVNKAHISHVFAGNDSLSAVSSRQKILRQPCHVWHQHLPHALLSSQVSLVMFGTSIFLMLYSPVRSALSCLAPASSSCSTLQPGQPCHVWHQHLPHALLSSQVSSHKNPVYLTHLSEIRFCKVKGDILGHVPRVPTYLGTEVPFILIEGGRL